MIAGLGTWEWNAAYWAAAKLLIMFSLPLFLLDLWLERTGDEYVFQSAALSWKLAFAAAAVVIVAFFGANQANAFIYFQF